MGRSEHGQESLCWTYSKWADSNCYTDGRGSICGRHNGLRRLRVCGDEENDNVEPKTFNERKKADH